MELVLDLGVMPYGPHVVYRVTEALGRIAPVLDTLDSLHLTIRLVVERLDPEPEQPPLVEVRHAALS